MYSTTIMDIETIKAWEARRDGIYLYVDLSRFKAYGFSAYALTQLFPELTLAQELHEGSETPVPYLLVSLKFIMENFSDHIKLADYNYIKANISDFDQSLVGQWRTEYDILNRAAAGK